MVYPYQKEFFFSNHCNCDEAPLRAHDTLGKVNIHWLQSGVRTAEENFQYFIPQRYDTEHHSLLLSNILTLFAPASVRNLPLKKFWGSSRLGTRSLSRSRAGTCRLKDAWMILTL